MGHIVVSAIGTDSPLRLGDEVLAIDGQRLAERLERPPGGATTSAGDVLSYRVERNGRQLVVDVTLHHFPLLPAIADWWPMMLVGVLLVATTVTVFWARPRDPSAHATLLTSAIGIVAIVGAGFFPLTAVDLVAGNQFWRHYTGQVAFALLWGAVLHFAIAYPATTLTRRQRWQVLAGYAGPVVLYGLVWLATVLLLPGPLERLYILIVPVLPALFVYPPVITTLLVRKFRRGGVPTRRPTLWLLAALIGSVVAYFVIWVVPVIVAGKPLVSYEMQALPFMAVPVAMSAAVLRHRALNIEVAVSRTVVYGALTIGAVGLYVAVVSLWSALFGPITSVWWQAAVAAAIAVVSQPVRARLQSLVNKRLYGDREDPYRVVSGLASRLENTPIVPALLPEIIETVAAALRLPHMAIEIQARGRSETAASVGTPTGELYRMPLTYHGERVGNLVVGRRSAQRELTRPDRIALAEVARHAGAAVYTARLTRDLRRSRDRLVQAREMERRRILHELHDGVGPTLAAIALGLDVSRRTVGDVTPTGELLGRLRDELQAAIVEIRRLAHGLRPPVLDRIGLIPAIREYAGALASRTGGRDEQEDGVTIVLEVPASMPKLPAPVDVAAYRIICEALTNVTRHASAKSCAVRLWVDDDLHIEVVDDGIGLPAVPGGGVGLSSMRERATELGGECLVEADHDGGTRVFATLPLPKEGG
ncbi:ATP-binding protein [Actinophytocola oryzae]|uniref:Oxygen sensor histidine kinase NreB n=1 Tax=Actinophytocola oryzae TaxID=502181 RepID=A0A4R7VB35_9PSEU|nr:histidine kinase [Actinophytocola oryzae]TDV46168.1 histidine kinase/DNA gyrase B/HSP90-like ATPase [Actinophytocola oryzae]